MCYVENKKDVNESCITNSKFPDSFKKNYWNHIVKKNYTVTNYTDLQYYNKIKYVKSDQLT